MKVLFVSYRNPNFTNTTIYREEAIKQLGHELIFFNDRDFIFPGRLRDNLDLLQKFDLRSLNNRLIKVAVKERPDICMVVGGHRVLPFAVNSIKNLNIKTVLWTTDAPVSFDNIIETAPLYDHIFCSGTEAIELFEKKRLKNITWIPYSCDPKYHHPVALSEKEKKQYQRDCVFVGSYYNNRAKVLENIADLDIGIWGPNWHLCDKNSPIFNKIIKKHVNMTEWIKIYSAAKIILAIHFNNGKTPCFQASPRVYEAMACKKLVITDSQKDTQLLFKDKEHLVIFNDLNDLKEKISYYLDNEPEREKIATAGYKEVLEKHTYIHRLSNIFDKIKTL